MENCCLLCAFLKAMTNNAVELRGQWIETLFHLHILRCLYMSDFHIETKGDRFYCQLVHACIYR